MPGIVRAGRIMGQVEFKSRQTKIAILIQRINGIVKQVPIGCQIGVALRVQPIGEIASYAALDLVIGKCANTGLVKFIQFFKEKGSDLLVKLIIQKIVDHDVIAFGKLVNPEELFVQAVKILQ